MKFKPGDEVVCVHDGGRFPSELKKGNIYIVRCCTIHLYPNLIELENIQTPWSAERFILVSEYYKHTKAFASKLHTILGSE